MCYNLFVLAQSWINGMLRYYLWHQRFYSHDEVNDSYYAALLPRRGPHIVSHSVCLSVCPSVPLSLPLVTSFRQPLASRMYFSARTEGRISYGHLGRTDSCYIYLANDIAAMALSVQVLKRCSFFFAFTVLHSGLQCSLRWYASVYIHYILFDVNWCALVAYDMLVCVYDNRPVCIFVVSHGDVLRLLACWHFVMLSIVYAMAYWQVSLSLA